jgi:phosphotransferase system HPr (HPr) family protein
MPTIEVTIVDEVGLHARPAARFVKAAMRFASEISVTNGERVADAKSLVQVLQLEANQGTTITIEATGDDADDALAALEAQLAGHA